ncbi:MAG: hypothetical protein ACXWCG_13180 [Flavitalea sp.]
MNPLSFINLILSVALLLLFSCEKNSEDLNPVPLAKCRIKSFEENSVVANIEYRNGKISRVTWSDGFLAQYNYDKDTVKILTTQSGSFASRHIVVNNASGLAEKVRYESNNSGTAGYVYTYRYKGTEVIESTQKPIGSATTVVTIYNWANGNLKQFTSGTSTTTFEYYNNKEVQEGDYLETVYLAQGFRYIKNKNLLKSIINSSSYGEIKYDFDKNGNIISAGITGTTPSNLSYTYQCN